MAHSVVLTLFYLLSNSPNLLQTPVEHEFTCPYCWEGISMILEPGAEEQLYVEDCEVCCNPIQIRFRGESEVEEFSAEPLGQ